MNQSFDDGLTGRGDMNLVYTQRVGESSQSSLELNSSRAEERRY
jgi:hypothetical protein